MTRHTWQPDNVLGPIQTCSRCPVVWWQWMGQEEPVGCVPIEDAHIDYAAGGAA